MSIDGDFGERRISQLNAGVDITIKEKQNEETRPPPSDSVLEQLKSSKGIAVLANIGRGTVGSLGIFGLALASPVILVIHLLATITLSPFTFKIQGQEVDGLQIADLIREKYFDSFQIIGDWIISEKTEKKLDQPKYEFKEGNIPNGGIVIAEKPKPFTEKPKPKEVERKETPERPIVQQVETSRDEEVSDKSNETKPKSKGKEIEKLERKYDRELEEFDGDINVLKDELRKLKGK